VGSIFTVLGLIILGPSPYIPENPWIELPNHYISILGLGLMGIGTAALLVCHFTSCSITLIENIKLFPEI